MKSRNSVEDNHQEQEDKLLNSETDPISQKRQIREASHPNTVLKHPLNTNGQLNLNITEYPLKRVVTNHCVYEDPTYRINMKLYVKECVVKVYIVGSSQNYTLVLKKQNLKKQFIETDTTRKTVIFKGNNFQLLEENIDKVVVLNLPLKSWEKEEVITLQPYSLADLLIRLKDTPFLEKRQTRSLKSAQKEIFEEPEKRQKQILPNKVKQKKDKPKEEKVKVEKSQEENEKDAEDNQEEDLKSPIKFSKNLSAEDIFEGEKIKRSLLKLKRQEKQSILTKVFKIKTVPKEEKRKFQCPIFNCGKIFVSHLNLRIHLQSKHPALQEHGIRMENGEFQVSEKALDFVLYLGKIYPKEIKKIIWQMKLKQPE